MKKKLHLSICYMLIIILSLCACDNNINYQEECTSTVTSNIDYLNQYINDTDNTLTEELEKMGVQQVEVQDHIYTFSMYRTGLLDGGVEYGFYYSDNDQTKLDKCISSNDYMVIVHITGNWYYYEWHNG